MIHDLANPNEKSGDALRDMAANLLSSRFGKVFTEKRVNGKKVDIFFETHNFGKKRRFYIEAKDYGERLQRKHLVTIYADYGGILKKNGPSELIIVSRHGISTDAEEYINENDNLSHLNIWELQNEVLGLTDYVRSLSTLFEKDGLDSYYMEARAAQAVYNDKEERTL